MQYPFDVQEAILWLADHADLILIFFDPIGQATCKRTMNVVEKLNNSAHLEKISYYMWVGAGICLRFFICGSGSEESRARTGVPVNTSSEIHMLGQSRRPILVNRGCNRGKIDHILY